jgi:flagellar basal body-associated protein FliL
MKRPVIISLLILALVLVCAGIFAVIIFTASNRLTGNNPFDKRNISSQVEENKTLKIDSAKPVTLKVDDAAGSVTVTGADVETVQVKAIKTAYDSSQARADAEVKTIKYSIGQDGNTITLTSTRLVSSSPFPAKQLWISTAARAKSA